MAWQIDPYHLQVEFAVKHFGMMTVRGHFGEVTATGQIDPQNPATSSVEVTIKTDSIKTNNPQRDLDLRSSNFLEIDKFPTITFKSTRIEPAGDDEYKMTGDLTIRNVTRPVTLDVVYSGQAKDPMGGVHAGFSAYTAINRKDWGLTWNVALETGGLLVSEEVKLALEVEVIKAAEAAAVA